MGVSLKGSRSDLKARLETILNGNGAIQGGTAFPTNPTPVDGQLFWRTDTSKLYIYKGSTAEWISFSGVTDHGDLTGLADDDHSIYIPTNAARAATTLKINGGTAFDATLTHAESAAFTVKLPEMPTGAVIPYAGSTAPNHWLLCYGQAVSRTDYASLFAVISTTYGAGDGSTTFNVPDLRGRAIAGKDDMGGVAASRLTSGGSGIAGTTLGAVGGSETHTLTEAQLPGHTHTIPNHSHSISTNTSAGGGAASKPTHGDGTGTNATMNTTSSGGGGATSSTGSGSAHNNTQPTMVLNYIIRT